MQGRMQMSTRIVISLWPEEEIAFPHLCGNPCGTKGTSDFARMDKGTENEKRYRLRVIKAIRTVELRRYRYLYIIFCRTNGQTKKTRLMCAPNWTHSLVRSSVHTNRILFIHSVFVQTQRDFALREFFIYNSRDYDLRDTDFFLCPGQETWMKLLRICKSWRCAICKKCVESCN